MSPTEMALFVAYPYLCRAVFVVGHAGRYLTDRYGWNAHSSELLEKRWLFPGTVLFHLGVLGTLAGHAVGLLVPQSVYDAVGIDSAAHTAFAHATGRVVGSAAFLGALLLLARRIGHPRVRRMSRPSDLVVLMGFFSSPGSALTRSLSAASTCCTRSPPGSAAFSSCNPIPPLWPRCRCAISSTCSQPSPCPPIRRFAVWCTSGVCRSRICCGNPSSFAGIRPPEGGAGKGRP